MMKRRMELEAYLNRSQESYARVVDRAAKLFRQRGFAAVTMNEIARAVGLSKAGLYHHCPSKEKLLADIFFLAGDLLLRQLALAAEARLSRIDRLKKFVVTRMEVVTQYQDFFTVVWQERAYVDTEAFADIRAISEEYRANVRALIVAAQQAGELRADVDAHLLMLAIDGMTGWAYLWYHEDGRRNPTEIGLAFWSFLERGVINRA